MGKDEHYSAASIELPGMKLLREKHEAKRKNSPADAKTDLRTTIDCPGSLVTQTMTSQVETDSLKKLETSISGEARAKGTEAKAPPSGYLDGVDRTIKYQTKPGAAVKRKKQYAQVKPYFNY